MQLRYCGIGEGWDDVIIKGNPDEMKFVAYYCKEGKVIAVASMQMDPIVTRSAELLRLGIMPTPEELRGGKDLYTVDLAGA
ncbi:Apoptosis-inducing factor 3 [Tulasnella sp. 424]|nr:Apoptosis-inducing factor 3 [Tulasnella sp. 424]